MSEIGSECSDNVKEGAKDIDEEASGPKSYKSFELSTARLKVVQVFVCALIIGLGFGIE